MQLKLLLALLVFAVLLGVTLGAPEPETSPGSTLSLTTPAPASSASPAATATPDVTETLDRELSERDSKILTLTLDEQLHLRAVQQKAAADPEVKEAADKRDAAVLQFRTKFREVMIKLDPSIGPVLDRIAVGLNPGF